MPPSDLTISTYANGHRSNYAPNTSLATATDATFGFLIGAATKTIVDVITSI